MVKTDPAERTVPPDVDRALELADGFGFDRSCSREVGRILQLLVTLKAEGRVGEIGTGCGVSTAWMASALHDEGGLYTIDVDRERTERVRELFAGRQNVHVMHGDWRELLAHAPFDVLFVDASEPKQSMPPEVIDALAPGGVLIVDDLTPSFGLDRGRQALPDPLRDRLFWADDLLAVELNVRPDEAIVLAVKRSRETA